MKRRPRLQAKPVIPSKGEVSKPVADAVDSDSALASENRSLAVSASGQVSSFSSDVDGLAFTEKRDVLEVEAKTDGTRVGVLPQNADRFALESFDVAEEENNEDEIFGNLITPDKKESGSVSSTDQHVGKPKLNGSGCPTALELVSYLTASQVPHSITVPGMEMSKECHLNDQNLDGDKEASIPSEECKESAEVGLEANCPPQKRRRFVRKQPNVKTTQSCTSVKMSASVSSIESSAEIDSPVSQTIVESASLTAQGDINCGNSSVSSVITDAADNSMVPSESTKSVDGSEISIDTVDLCKSPLPVPMSPPVFSPKVRHHFTKVRPNLTNSLTSKHSMSDRLPKVSPSTVDDGPFIPPLIAASRSATCGLEKGVATEESVVVLSETVEKAAAKLIARKLKQKKKKRALENLDAPIDSSKVCMRDLIYMNPVNNPMKSKVAESVSNDSVKSPAILKRPSTSTPALSPAPVIEKVAAPQLKIGPDGSIIINEASLVIERQPVPNFNDMEAIDETEDSRCGYPKRSRTRSWNKKETRKFFAALSMIGTDFFLMMNLFPGRTRAELKRKFKREEKVHQAMVETALSDRRSLDMSLMAVHSSDEEEVKPKGKQPGKRGPRANKKQPSDVSADKGKVLGGKENDPQPVSMVKKEKKRKREEKQPGKKQKKKKSRYYDESSDEHDEEIEKQLERRGRRSAESGSLVGCGDAESTAEEEDDHRTIAKVPSPHLSDEDEVEMESCFSRQPTRSGRVPKPVKSYNPVKFSDLEDSAVNVVPSTKNHSLAAKRRPESSKLQTTIPSTARSAGLMSPPPVPFMSPARVPCSSPRSLCSPLPFFGSSPPYSSPAHAPILSPLVSCSPSSPMSLLTAGIPGLENVPPGKQLMIVASPVMSSDAGEPPQQLLHVFMVSSPAAPFDTCSDGQDPMESTPNGNCLLDLATSSVVAHSSNSRTGECSTSNVCIVSTASQYENNSSPSIVFSGSICTVANHKDFNQSQVISDSCTFSPTGFRTPLPFHSNLDTRKSESFGTDVSQVSTGSKLEETLISTLFPARRRNNSSTLDRTDGTNGSVSPFLSTSALEYCISQVTNATSASLRFGFGSEDGADHESVDEDDIELEGNITDVLQQDDGTLVIIAESASVISSNGVPDPESDVKLQSTESVEVPLEKDSDSKGGSTKQVPHDRSENEEEDSEAVDVKFESGTNENGYEDIMDEFIEVFIEAMPELGPILSMGTLSGIETMKNSDIMSYSANCKSETADLEEKPLDKVKCQTELVLAEEKCISGYNAESVAEKCISSDLESIAIFKSTEPNSYPCADVLPSVTDDVNITLELPSNATEETTDTDVSSRPLQNNNNANNNIFLNVVSLPDGSFEILLDSEGFDQQGFCDIEFPVVDELGRL